MRSREPPDHARPHGAAPTALLAGYEAVLYDTNDDSRWEWALTDLDNNGSFAWFADRDRDGRLGDHAFVDGNHDGRFETHLYDAGEEGHADGHADTWYSHAAQTSSTSQTTGRRWRRSTRSTSSR